jgi:hypothetical protein
MIIYRLNGKYFGFVSSDCLFSKKSEYLGFILPDGTFWKADGNYAGELFEESYIIRRSSIATPAKCAAPAAPARPAIPAAPANIAPRAPMSGVRDVLDDFKD